MADPDRCVVQEGHQVLYRDVCSNHAMDQLTETSPLDIYMNLIWNTSLMSYNLYGLSFELQCTSCKTSLFGCMLKSASVTKRVLTQLQLAVLLDMFLFKLEFLFSAWNYISIGLV